MNKLINIVSGCFMAAIGVIILRHSHIVTGGTAGLSLNLSYYFGISFGTLFFAVNIPFYIFSFLRMGWKFTLSTLSAVTILSIMTGIDKWLPSFTVPSLIGAVAGGLIIGLGLSFLFMNGASLGGTNMLALFLQKRYNINPGKTNFVIDLFVVSLSFYSVGPLKGLLSILSIAITSTIISYFKGKISTSHIKAENIKTDSTLLNAS